MTVNRKRGPQKRTIEKAQSGLLDFFKAAGIEVSEDEIKAAYETKYTPKEHPDTAMLQAEGMLLHIRHASKHFMAKRCLECKEAFSTTYIAVSYCSALCRGTAIERQMGIRWDYESDHYQNLEAERPLIVGPQAYQELLKFARRVLDQHEILVQDADPTPDVSSEDTGPNQSVPDTTPVVSPPQQGKVVRQGLFGPVPF
jgi:hypothetical protein